MKNTKLFFVGLAVVLTSALNAQSADLRKEIEKIIRFERPVDFNLVPSVLVGVIDGDSTFTYNFGAATDVNGIYELGSLSKPYTAWLVTNALMNENKTRDEPICAYLPDSLCTNEWKKITFFHLLNHQAGLQRFAPGIGEFETDIQDPYKDYHLSDLAEDIHQLHPVAGRYSYSHIGYAMMHWVFEKHGGLENFTLKNLTHPYLLHNTSWTVAADQIATGHGLDGRVQPPWDANALAPAMGLKSSLQDVLTFMRLLMFGYDSNQKLLPTSSLNRELKILAKAGAYKVVDGWFVIRSGKKLVYYHNGRTGGHHVSVAFTPHLKKGVVVISNGAMGSNDLSLLILRMINQARK